LYGSDPLFNWKINVKLCSELLFLIDKKCPLVLPPVHRIPKHNSFSSISKYTKVRWWFWTSNLGRSIIIFFSNREWWNYNFRRLYLSFYTFNYFFFKIFHLSSTFLFLRSYTVILHLFCLNDRFLYQKFKFFLFFNRNTNGIMNMESSMSVQSFMRLCTISYLLS